MLAVHEEVRQDTSRASLPAVGRQTHQNPAQPTAPNGNEQFLKFFTFHFREKLRTSKLQRGARWKTKLFRNEISRSLKMESWRKSPTGNSNLPLIVGIQQRFTQTGGMRI